MTAKMPEKPDMSDPEGLLLPAEVAKIFRVDAKTVTRWHQRGKFEEGEVIKTGGGHLRIRVKAVERLMQMM